MSLNWSFPVHPGSMANSSENTSLDGNFSIHHCNHIRKWAYFFNLFELCFLVVDLIIGIIASYVIYNVPLFHKNLMNLIQCLNVCWVISMASRLLATIWLFYYPDGIDSTSLFVQTFPVVYAEQMRVCAAGAAAATLFCIIIERIMATTKLQSYEKQRNKKFIAFTVCYSCFFGGLSTFFVFSHEINLLGFEVAGAFFSLCLVGMLMYDSLLDNNNKLHSFVIRTAYNLMVCVISLLAIVVGIASTAVWRRQIIKMFKKCTFCLSCAIQSRRISEFHTRTSFSSEEVIIVRRVSRTHLRNGDGKPMAFSHEVEKDMYFAHLRQTWS